LTEGSNHIGRYQIVGELGRGGMGTVYRALDPQSGDEVAIKVLVRGRKATPHQRKRFDREARALAKLSHPSVVRLRDVGEDRGLPYLVMDYHSGGTLEEMLTGVGLSCDRVAEVGAQLAEGLAAAHERGILHRDLKPENVVFSSAGRALLTDFGIAKDLDRVGLTEDLTKSGALLGTPGYWAPELIAAKPGTDGRLSDVYGLGATLYAALTGRPPAEGESLIEVVASTEAPTPPVSDLRPDVPAELEAVVMRSLERDTTKRWASAETFAGALRDCLAGGPTPRRSPAWAFVLIAGALGLGAQIGILAASQVRGAATPPAESPSPSPTVAPQAPEPRQASTAELYAQGRAAKRARRYEEARRAFRAASEGGRIEAMPALAVMLRLGEGGPKDTVEALRWLRLAAEKGDSRAMHHLGLLSAAGTEVPLSETEARRWFARAARAGSTNGMTDYASLLLKGRGGPKDEVQAGEWFRRAAKKGHPEAMWNLARLLELGVGLAKNTKRAVRWFKQAAKKGDARIRDASRRALQRLDR
jgi:hypothetical protein